MCRFAISDTLRYFTLQNVVLTVPKTPLALVHLDDGEKGDNPLFRYVMYNLSYTYRQNTVSRHCVVLQYQGCYFDGFYFLA